MLNDVEGISETAVFGFSHHDFGEMIVAACVPLGLAEFEEGALRAAVEGRLVGFKHPGVYCEMNALPRNNMGKVQKKHPARKLYCGRVRLAFTSAIPVGSSRKTAQQRRLGAARPRHRLLMDLAPLPWLMPR